MIFVTRFSRNVVILTPMKASVYLLGRFDKSHHSIANIPIYLVFSGHDFSTHFFNPRNRLNPRNR